MLVTGASRGIGYAAAMEAARRGAHVVAVARTVGGLEELDDAIQAEGGSATLVPMNLIDFDAIDRMGAALFERWGRLDGLIGNAGALTALGPVPHIDPKDFDKVMSLNVTANYRLLRSFDLPLRKAQAGRVVMISSSASETGKPYWGLYATSKAALNAIVRAYAAEMSATSVRANVIYPGAVLTALRATAIPGEDPDALPKPADVAPMIVDMVSPNYSENSTVFVANEKTWRAL